jgi:hypothetical protein
MPFNHLGFPVRILLAVLLLVQAVPARGAGSNLAPLVDSQTTAVLRVSCSRFDFQRFYQTAVNVAEDVAEASIQDPDTLKKVKASLPLLLATYLTGVKSVYDTFKELRLDEIYFVVTPDTDTSIGFVAIPIPELSDEEFAAAKKALLSFRSPSLPFCFARHGYIFAPLMNPGIDQDRLKEYVRDRFTELYPEPRADLEAGLAEFPEAVAELVITGNDNSAKMLAHSLEEIQNSSDRSETTPYNKAGESITRSTLALGREALYAIVAFDQTDNSVKIRTRFRKGYDPKPAVNDIYSSLLETLDPGEKSSDSPENTVLFEEFVKAVMPQTAPERLDWKIDQEYIRTNFSVIKGTLTNMQKSRQLKVSESRAQEE